MDALPPYDRTALLIDLDGTLLDIAPTPDSVVVPAGLTDTLTVLRGQLGDALAVVTGRPIETVDRLLGRAVPSVAGEHGGAIRFTPDGVIERPNLLSPPEAWLRIAQELADAYPGALLERKARGFALHYRACPEAGPVFHLALAGLLDGNTAFQLLPAHMLWEVRPAGADKGRGVAELMKREPFEGRMPVFIGDDVTDEDGMRVARAMGGAGYRVDATFGTPEGVRRWLHALAQNGDWPELPGSRAQPVAGA